ncbi:MAG TPA: hypothetical protein VGW33_14580 [Terriglobia bacterium]|nr:hypothetical protein [Terriglobia bacterium]
MAREHHRTNTPLRLSSVPLAPRLLRLSVVAAAGAIAAVAFFAASPSRAQEEHKNRVLTKIESGGPAHGEFTGTVQSLDLKEQVLNVSATRGDDTEIFPIKKNVHVSTADGKKLKLASLAPGTTVLVNYEQKGDRRTVKQIVVIASPAEGAAKPPPPS